MAFRPVRLLVLCGALLLLLLAAASTTAALLLLPAVTLHRLHRAVTKLDDDPATRPPAPLRESRSSPPACHQSNTGRATRPQGADCRFAEPHARSSLARSPEPAPAGGRGSRTALLALTTD